MTATTHSRQFGLAPRELFDIPDVSEVEITCTRGSLWITLDNDPHDIVLEAGETFFSTERRRGLVYAFQASTVALQPLSKESKTVSAPGSGLVTRALAA